jgi:prepilin-type N-terminal cleavage/methylation domain-containing protein/prepilin-type processing-associated H-X9-DG protein
MIGVRRTGFTLIELLVVIAIIAILAGMLFPVFARARESARKIQCLSNVKNIAMAMEIYLTDYDSFPPRETRWDVIQWMEANPPYGPAGCLLQKPDMPSHANPYLRWSVVLDEYTKNRDVWRCPSAKTEPCPIVILPGPDWFKAWSQHFACVCNSTWPPGWGGTITDSTQIWNTAACGSPTVGNGAVEFSISVNEDWRGTKMSALGDPTTFVFVADNGGKPLWFGAERLAYPDLCRDKLGAATINEGCRVNPDCSSAWVCGVPWPDLINFWHDPSMRKQWSRHLGGSNLGFIDGHAQWWPSDEILRAAGDWTNKNPGMQGVYCVCLPDSPTVSNSQY